VTQPGSFQGFYAAKQAALEQAQPLGAYFELTYRCNWRCVFCFNPRHNDLEPLSTPEWIAILDDLRELGTLWLTLTGGEPLAHPDFLKIAREARSRGFAIRVFSNGTLVDKAMAVALAELRPSAFEMSLHGSTADVHDRATAKPGSFDAMFVALRLLRERNVPLLLKTPITNMNEHQFDEIVELARRTGVPLKIDQTLTPRDDGDLSPLDYRASVEGRRRIAEKLLAIGQLPGETGRAEGAFNCGLGRITMAIDPEGNVYPCIQWRSSSLGNVRATPLRVLWRESSVRRETAEIARSANTAMLARGDAASKFPFCPALAMARTGDPHVPAPEHLELARIAEEVRRGAA
jgi:MoaA/NifB/PqqE/SkfB family radical SAM enzyme